MFAIGYNAGRAKLFAFLHGIRAEREGDPNLIDRIADENDVNSVDELMAWLEEHNHPALVMDSMF